MIEDKVFRPDVACQRLIAISLCRALMRKERAGSYKCFLSSYVSGGNLVGEIRTTFGVLDLVEDPVTRHFPESRLVWSSSARLRW